MVSGPTPSTSPGSAFTDVSPYVAGATVSISIPGNRQNGGDMFQDFPSTSMDSHRRIPIKNGNVIFD